MLCRRSCRQGDGPIFKSLLADHNKQSIRLFPLLFLTLMTAAICRAQDQPKTANNAATHGSTPDQASLTVPAGTSIALVLTHPIQSRHIHRGDDIYAQITSPVSTGNEVAIPPGTFVQGTVEKLEMKGGRGELHLQSMTITFPDGYVTSLNGPVTLKSDEGYALKDPGQSRSLMAILLPAGGAGIGALIGHAAANPQPTTLTASIPPGCTGPPPGCVSSSTTAPGSAGKATFIGAGVGGAVGAVASLALLFGSHHFFLDVGTPVEMKLEQPLSLPQAEVNSAVRQSQQNPVAEQPVAPRPRPVPPPASPADHGTCYTPGMPGTPPTVIPGPPGPDGIPGPPTIIPGTPGTPPTPYPCP